MENNEKKTTINPKYMDLFSDINASYNKMEVEEIKKNDITAVNKNKEEELEF